MTEIAKVFSASLLIGAGLFAFACGDDDDDALATGEECQANSDCESGYCDSSDLVCAEQPAGWDDDDQSDDGSCEEPTWTVDRADVEGALGFGYTCVKSGDCASGICVLPGSGDGVCSFDCPCEEDGWVCDDSLNPAVCVQLLCD